jgi:hypothetical protein
MAVPDTYAQTGAIAVPPIKEASMRVKLFSRRVREKNVDLLEREFNDWLVANPTVKPRFVELLTRPTFAWSTVVVSVWYEEA